MIENKEKYKMIDYLKSKLVRVINENKKKDTIIDCLRKKKLRHDLTGKKFGNLEVLDRDYNTKLSVTSWNVSCFVCNDKKIKLMSSFQIRNLKELCKFQLLFECMCLCSTN